MNDINSVNTNNDTFDYLKLPTLVTHNITMRIIPLPEDILKKIAQYLKPIHLVKCCMVSKEIKTFVESENDFWEKHWFKRWSSKDKNADLDYICGNVVYGIDTYRTYYLKEKKAKNYFKLLFIKDNDQTSDFQLKHKQDKALFEQAYPYILGESPKASWLYLAGHFGLKTLLSNSHYSYKDTLEWLEKAAKKGHILAAYELGLEYMFSELMKNHRMYNYRPDPDRYEKSIQWLQFAANKNHEEAKEILHHLKTREFDKISNNRTSLNNLNEKSQNELISILCKRPHEDSEQPEAEPPTKKFKTS